MPVMDNGVLILSLSRKIVRSGRSYQESFVKCVFFGGGGQTVLNHQASTGARNGDNNLWDTHLYY